MGSGDRRHGDALVLVDLVPAGPFEEAGALMERMLALAQPVGALLARARRAGVPVVWVNDHHGRWDLSLAQRIDEALEGPLGPLFEAVAPQPGEPTLLKPRHSGFYQTPLAYLLDELGVERVVLLGGQANVCVLFTAQDAHVRGLDIAVPRDGVAGLTAARERDALRVVRHLLGEASTPSCAELELRAPGRARSGGA